MTLNHYWYFITRLLIAAFFFVTNTASRAHGQAPAKAGLVQPATIDPKARTIIFVHGLGSNCDATFSDFITKSRTAGIQVLTFEYPNHGPIADSGKQFAVALRKLESDYPQFRAAVVGHSMGGLVARYALEIVNPAPACVTDFFTIATPHGGSMLAGQGHLLRVSENFLTLASTPAKFWADGRGEACRDLTPGSAFLKGLATGIAAEHLKYHVILGSKAVFTPDEWASAQKEILRIGKHRQRWSDDEITRVASKLSSLDEVVHGKGDGAVAMSRGKLAWATSETIFDLGHLELTRGPGHEAVWMFVLKILLREGQPNAR